MDVVVVGSCNTDLISYVKRAPKPAETLTGERFEVQYTLPLPLPFCGQRDAVCETPVSVYECHVFV
eukprot:m.151850 g.151850  ORF g.151850 m.151850 type:complete len:66 (+) comp14258_c1_seq1:483-680(+)